MHSTRLQGRFPIKPKPTANNVFFDSESWRQAAFDLIAAEIAPKEWAIEKRQAVVKLIRQGKPVDEIAGRYPELPRADIEDLRKKVRGSNTIRELIRNSMGSVAVEFVAVFPLLVIAGFLTIAAVQWGQLSFATQSAANCGATGNTQCNTLDATAQYAANNLPTATFSASAQGCGVQVTGSTTIQVPFVGTVPLGASSCYPTIGAAGGIAGPLVNVADLPDPMAHQGEIWRVKDASNPQFGQAPSGGGTATAPVIADAAAGSWVVR